MKMRLALCAFLVILAVVLLSYAAHTSDRINAAEICAGLACETIGIAATVGVVDFLLERQRNDEAANRVAWSALHGLDDAVWIWQGGDRRFDASELLGLIDAISDQDPLPEFTRNVLLRLGGMAQNTLNTSREIVQRRGLLRKGLEDLTGLCRLGNDPQITNHELQSVLRSASTTLLRVVDIMALPASETSLVVIRDCSISAQEWRHFGRRE